MTDPDAAAGVEILSDRVPSQEATLAAEPDLVFAGWESNLTAEGAGDRGTLEQLGVHTYVAPAACQGDGYRPDPLTFDGVFAGFEEAGAIFGVTDAAADLVAEQRAALEAIEASDAGLTALWYSSGDDQPFVGAGTGGTFTGLARYFKEKDAGVRAVLVEPQGSIWGGGPPGPHKVEGIGNNFWPPALDRALVDEVRTVPDDPSFAAVRELARKEGLLVGGSSGAAAHAARDVARELGPGKVVVTVFPDGFERYLGKGVFENL